VSAPSFSVVIPTFNRGVSILPSIRSVLDQTYSPAEIFVVDDASDPPTARLAPILEEHPAISYVYLERNSGVSVARNTGLRLATAEYVSFLDDDDRFDPGKLRKLANVLRGDPSIDVLYHALSLHLVREKVRFRNDPSRGPISIEEMLTKNVLDGGTSMLTVRRSTLLEVGGFDEELPAVEDYELILRLRLAGAKFFYVDETLTEWDRDTSRKSRTISLENDIRAWERIHSKYAREYARLAPAAWADHLQKIDQYRGFRCVVAHRRRQAAWYFARAFGRRPAVGALPLLVAGLVALCSPRLVMVLQGRLKSNPMVRSVHRPMRSGESERLQG
jgi:glycosyltransferase involved in cell wall biosynthesis